MDYSWGGGAVGGSLMILMLEDSGLNRLGRIVMILQGIRQHPFEILVLGTYIGACHTLCLDEEIAMEWSEKLS